MFYELTTQYTSARRKPSYLGGSWSPRLGQCLLTENLNPGQHFGPVRVVNTFAD